jgi:hypothetical protein
MQGEGEGERESGRVGEWSIPHNDVEGSGGMLNNAAGQTDENTWELDRPPSRPLNKKINFEMGKK